MDLEVKCDEGDICQIGIVVSNLEESLKRYTKELNIGPWYIWRFETPEWKDLYYKGIKIEKALTMVALAKIGPMQYELVQPVFGMSLHQDHLDKKGEGLHHMKLYYKDIPSTIEKFRKIGIHPLSEGKYKDDRYVYLDTEDKYGLIYEIGNAGDIGEPLEVYPKN